MNQLNGKYVNVVLSVESGKGMEFIRNGVHIVGIFNNRILESDRVSPSETPLFNTELVWEVDKRQLRKIRSANQPLRVECVCADAGNRRERVGFALLSLRAAQIVPESEAERELGFAWHRLIGCQGDKRRKKCPELYLSLALRDHLPNACAAVASVPFIAQQIGADEPYRPVEGVAVRYLDDGYIQIGRAGCAADDRVSARADDGCANQDKYLLNLLVRSASNLHALLPEVVVFNSTKPDCFLKFQILGVTVRTRPIRCFEGRILLDEKIVVNLLSDEGTLRNFFSEHKIPVTFGCGEDPLGVAEVPTSFELGERECFFRYPSANGIVPFGSDGERSPCIKIDVWVSPATTKQVTSTFSKASLEDVDEEDDETQQEAIQTQPQEVVPETQLDHQDPKPPKLSTHTSETYNQDPKILDHHKFSPHLEPRTIDTPDGIVDPMEPYRKYLVELDLTGLLWLSAPTTDKITFRFLHPNAATCVSILTETPVDLNEEVSLGTVGFKLGYITTPARLNHLTSIWQPWLVLGDQVETPMTQPARLGLDNNAVELRDLSGGLPLARVRYEVSTRCVRLEESEDYEQLYLLPAVLDDSVAVKNVSELETWKVSRRSEFESGLKTLRSNLIERLGLEYQEKKEELERKLSVGIRRCHDLQDQLRTKLNGLRNERELERYAFKDYSEIFRANWQRFGSETSNSRELIELLSKTQRDNHKLKQLLDQKTKKLDTIQRCALSKTQTAHLLDELRQLEAKFEDARETKRYFKEQWRRACEEVHGLRVEELNGLRAQIKKSREELGDRGDVGV